MDRFGGYRVSQRLPKYIYILVIRSSWFSNKKIRTTQNNHMIIQDITYKPEYTEIEYFEILSLKRKSTKNLYITSSYKTESHGYFFFIWHSRLINCTAPEGACLTDITGCNKRMAKIIETFPRTPLFPCPE